MTAAPTFAAALKRGRYHVVTWDRATKCTRILAMNIGDRPAAWQLAFATANRLGLDSIGVESTADLRKYSGRVIAA